MNIQKLVDDKIAGEQEPRKFSGKIGASVLGQCYRRSYWSINREPMSNPPDERTLRVFYCGDIFHEFLQNIIKEQGYEVEVKFEDDIVSLRADAMNENEIVEIKSVHSKAFWYMDKELKEKTIQEIKPEHICQATLGAMMLGKEFIRLVYVSKDDLCIKEFLMKVTPENRALVSLELLNIKKNLEEKVLPDAKPRLYPQKDKSFKECEWCAWKDKCNKI